MSIAIAGSTGRTMVDASSVLGLANTEIRHELAHAEWAKMYEREAHLLRAALGATLLEIEHVGSTAVPGLIAKPILDVIVSVLSLDDMDGLASALANIGWQWRPAGDSGGRRYFVKGPPENRTGHLSIVMAGTPAWEEQVRFRDFLRANPDLAARYAELKRVLAIANAGDRRAYTLGKADFIAEVLANSTHG